MVDVPAKARLKYVFVTPFFSYEQPPPFLVVPFGVATTVNVIYPGTTRSNQSGGPMTNVMLPQPSQGVLDEDIFGVKVPALDGYRAKQCPVRPQHDLDDSYDESDKDEDTSQTVAIMAEGVEFEAVIAEELASLHDVYHANTPRVFDICASTDSREDKLAALAKTLSRHKVVFVPDCDRSVASKKRRELITHACMKVGVKLIWNARLESDGLRAGEPDFLVREEKRDDGLWGYFPCDVKHHTPLSGAAKPREWPVSPLGDPYWESATPTLVSKGTPRLDDAMQLCHYTRMLEFLGHRSQTATRGSIVGKNRAAVWYDLTDPAFLYVKSGDQKRTRTSAMDIYDAEFSFRRQVARRVLERNNGSSDELLVQPEWKQECHTCPWRTVCKDDLKARRHITLQPGITPARAKAHYAQGVFSVDDLARLDVPTAVIVDCGGDVSKVKAQARRNPSDGIVKVLNAAGMKKSQQAASKLAAVGIETTSALAKLDTATGRYSNTGVFQLARSIDQARVTIAERVHRARGVDRVSIANPAIALHFDVENDGDYVYLIRFYAVGKSAAGKKFRERFESHAFVCWDGTSAGEAQLFADCWGYIQDMHATARVGKWSLRAFHYTAHERGVFKMLAQRHQGHPGIPSSDEVEAWFDSKYVVDLHEILSKQLLWPTEDVTLKTLAKYVRFMWRDEDPSGANSIAWYRQAVDMSLTEAQREESRARVLDYNEDDCKATAALVEFIYRLGEARKPASKLPSVDTLDRRFRRRKR